MWPARRASAARPDPARARHQQQDARLSQFVLSHAGRTNSRGVGPVADGESQFGVEVSRHDAQLVERARPRNQRRDVGELLERPAAPQFSCRTDELARNHGVGERHPSRPLDQVIGACGVEFALVES